MRTLIAICSSVLALSLIAPTASAGPQQGVRCPSGFDALISDGNRKLICRRTVNYERDAVCPPGAKLDEGGTGLDMCVAQIQVGPNPPAVRVPAMPSAPIVNMPWHHVVSDFKQVARPGQPDKFVATAHEFRFPELGPVYPPHPLGDATKGVTCPAGFDGDKVFDGRGIRCDKRDGEPKSADCDGIVGWEWRQDLVGDEDRCRNVVTGETGPTKPAGMTKVQHDLDRARDDAGWLLNKRPGARDTWQRKVYAFPIQ